MVYFLTASLLDPDSSDPTSNGLVEELQLVQPQFVERYFINQTTLSIALQLLLKENNTIVRKNEDMDY